MAFVKKNYLPTDRQRHSKTNCFLWLPADGRSYLKYEEGSDSPHWSTRSRVGGQVIHNIWTKKFIISMSGLPQQLSRKS